MVVCNPNDLGCLIGVALDLIARARARDADVDEALDGLWEVLVNVDYMVRRGEGAKPPCNLEYLIMVYLN
jgi:hypothetical protein